MTMFLLPSVFWTESVVKSPRAVAELSQEDMFVAFIRHIHGDWGELDQFDWQVNDDALEYGGRLASQYCDVHGTTFLIITERDRSVTKILLPGDAM